MAVLREPRDSGLLVETYSPGGPGAVRMFDGEREDGEQEDVEHALKVLPLLWDGIVETEVTELHPFNALSAWRRGRPRIAHRDAGHAVIRLVCAWWSRVHTTSWFSEVGPPDACWRRG
jgi:hypothetical protein